MERNNHSNLWRLTFAVGRELDSHDLVEILQKTNAKSVNLLGKAAGSNRHDYNLYALHDEPLPREGLEYLKEQGFAVVNANALDKKTAAEIFPIDYVVGTIKKFR